MTPHRPEEAESAALVQIQSVTEQHGQSLLPILESCLQHGQFWKEPLVLQVTTSLFEHCRMSAADHGEPGFPSLKK